MYQNTLSQTAENILSFLLKHLEEEFSIREIAQAIKQDYKIVFTTIQSLSGSGQIKMDRVSNINRGSIVVHRDHASLFSWVSIRQQRRCLPDKVRRALDGLLMDLPDPFCSVLVFGSYAKGSAKPASDLDLLVIVADKRFEPGILAAVKKASTLSNIHIQPVIFSTKEFLEGLKEPSVAQEAYQNHLIIYGGEVFYTLIGK